MTPPHPSAAVSSHRVTPLTGGWQLAATAPGACRHPGELEALTLPWRAAAVPGTAALSDPGRSDYDACDWWYRCSFAAPQPVSAPRLRCDGLATLAEVWLNGEPLLTSDNMFLPVVVDVAGRLQPVNELVICFRSLDAALAARRPRPRWKTALVNQQQLRWVRTTLLGRIPGWTPPIAPVGPWRGITLEYADAVDVQALSLYSGVRDGAGTLQCTARLALAAGRELHGAWLCLDGKRYALEVAAEGTAIQLAGSLEIADAPLWWPHTHGEPRLLACRLELRIGADTVAVDCGRVGFKSVHIDRRDGQVQLQVNGEPVFCRGACWTVNDFNALHGDPATLREVLLRAREAGVNMLRIGGTMTYEADAFYALCDELGILVWQDFMFANMDYPVADTAFRSGIDAEVCAQLTRLQRHACIAVYCGGSEIEQQAAMLGLPPAEWSNEFFAAALPEHCARLHPGIPYFPSTPWGGALPFHVASGISHYYGVGAYRRPLSDVKHAGVKFTPECLGFANVPDREILDKLLGGATPMPHHPAWKAGVPRDNGAGWDFEDIRDHYLAALFGVDPIALRSCDPERYYALSRAVTGEVMQHVYAEWRRPHSSCGGALVWFFKDLRPGAGWGILDSDGRPKAVYWYLKRAWAQRALLITDEGLDGLQLHVCNEHDRPLRAVVELELLQRGRIQTAAASQVVEVPARGTATLVADAMLSYFSDITYAYRFGPPQHDVVVSCLRCADTGRVLSEACYFPGGLNLPVQEHAQISAEVSAAADGSVLVDIESDCFLQAVAVDAGDYRADDNYFHLAPRRRKQLRFVPCNEPAKKFKVYFSALNLRETITVRGGERNQP